MKYMEKFVGELAINFEKIMQTKIYERRMVPQKKQKQCEDLFEKKIWNSQRIVRV